MYIREGKCIPENGNSMSKEAEKKTVQQTLGECDVKFKIQVETELARPGRVDNDDDGDDHSS